MSRNISTIKRKSEQSVLSEMKSGGNVCAHWVPRKKRFCKMVPAEGFQYCVEHQNEENPEVLTDERIACPLDPKHTVYKKKLLKHLKVCNVLTITPQGAHIQKNINAGLETDGLEDSKQLKLHELSNEEFFDVVKTVKDLYAKYVEGKICEFREKHSLLDDELAHEEYGKDTKKHLLQAAALLGILQKEEQYQNDTVFIEFGAGKGQLAFYIAQVLEKYQNSQVVLIDRMSLRHKKDNKIENKDLIKRIRADIADLKLEGLEILQTSKRYVGISKHLCGAATDLALRCISRVPQESGTAKMATEFIMIALCCHHRCDWRSFVGKKFFTANKITPREFKIITKMASWAVCGTGFSRDRRHALEEQKADIANPSEHETKAQRLSVTEREEVGFLCKRLLDYARLEFLEEHGYKATLSYYVEKDVTLENVCLLAKKL